MFHNLYYCSLNYWITRVPVWIYPQYPRYLRYKQLLVRNSSKITQHKLLIYLGFNRCPYQLLRSYKRHEENKSKNCQKRSPMQQADYQCHRPTPWMQESVSMHKSQTSVRHSRMNQARSAEEEKKKKDRRLMERNSAYQNKNLSEELKQARTTKVQLRLTKQGEWTKFTPLYLYFWKLKN